MSNLDNLAVIFLVVGILLFICFVILAVKYHMIRTIADLSGITAKRSIKNMKSSSSKYKPPVKVTQKIVTDRITSNQTAVLSEGSYETSILSEGDNSKFDLESEIGFHDSKEIIR